jgi:hypothetical protein
MPRDAIRVIGSPLELELRFWEVGYMMEDGCPSIGESRLLFWFGRVDGDSRRFRPAREFVQRDVLVKMRAMRKDEKHYALHARAVGPLAQRSAPRNGR